MDRSQPAGNLMDAHERLVADILTRYRTLLMLATVQAEGDRANHKPQAIAVAGISMRMEFDGLFSSIKELLALSRKMKELWVFGPLGGNEAGNRATEGQIEEDVGRISELLGSLEGRSMRELAEKCGGEWAPLRNEETQ